MKYIKTGMARSDGKRRLDVMVDDQDYEWLNQYYWQANKQLCVNTKINGVRVLIHRLILNPDKNIEIDHIDGNRLNNQRSNLRLATSSQNKCNRGPRKDCVSGYKGVSWHKQNKKWTARIMGDGKYRYLGLFLNIQDAVNAYNQAAIKYQKEFAFINPL